MKTVKCNICGKVFQSKATNVKYCSLRCKYAGERARRERWKNKYPGYMREYMKNYRKKEETE